MNDLENFFWKQSDRYIWKWTSYFKFYDKYFSKFRNRKCKILEIGVYRGGSLQMWQNYFSKDSLVVGMDINPECSAYTGENIEIFIGDQSNKEHLSELVKKYGKFDVIIDDGSHVAGHQIASFEYLIDYLNDDGVYLVEDVMGDCDTDIPIDKNFTSLARKIINNLNDHFYNPDQYPITKYTKCIEGIYFHFGMIFFEKSKAPIEKPNMVYSVAMRDKNNKT